MLYLVCLWACVMFFSLQVDRGNLSQAVSGTFLQDLHLSTNGLRIQVSLPNSILTTT